MTEIEQEFANECKNMKAIKNNQDYLELLNKTYKVMKQKIENSLIKKSGIIQNETYYTLEDIKSKTLTELFEMCKQILEVEKDSKKIEKLNEFVDNYIIYQHKLGVLNEQNQRITKQLIASRKTFEDIALIKTIAKKPQFTNEIKENFDKSIAEVLNRINKNIAIANKALNKKNQNTTDRTL